MLSLPQAYLRGNQGRIYRRLKRVKVLSIPFQMNVPGTRYPHPNLASLFLALYPPHSALESYQMTTQYLEQVCSTRASTWIIVYVLEALSEMSRNLQSDAVKSLGRFEGLVTAQALSQIPALDFTSACPGQEFSLISPLPT